MKKSHLEVISRYTGVFPVRINSNLVSAQNRDRWYWTNVKTKEVGLFGEIYSDIPHPKDRGILLRDILEKDVDEKYYLSDKMINVLSNRPKGYDTFEPLPDNTESKARCITSRIHKMGSADNYILQLGRGFNKGGLHQDKTHTVSSNSWEQNNLLCIGNIYNNGQNSHGGRVYDINHKSATLNGEAGGGGAKTGLYLVDENVDNNSVIQLNPSTESGGKQPYQHNRVYADYGKMTCLDTDSGRKSVFTNYRIRRLTPTECARLQTIPDWYEWIVSDTQIYKQCGNGWTIEVIKHILSQWDLVNESVLTKAI